MVVTTTLGDGGRKGGSGFVEHGNGGDTGDDSQFGDGGNQAL